jgi:hypothetical protein
MENQLVKIVTESGLEQSKGQILLEKFSNYFNIAADWEQKAKALTVTDVTQVAEMKMAREGRLFLKQKRVDVENTRKMLKEQSLREGQTIDSIARILKNVIEPIEQDLEQKEKFAETQEAKRRAELKVVRDAEIEPYMEYLPYQQDLGAISDEQYQKLLAFVKLQHDQKVEAEQKAEAERLAKEKAEAEERERIRKENEMLKIEAEKKAKELEKERAKAEAERRALEEKARKEKAEADAKLKAERDAREKIERELRAKAEAEAKAKRDEEARLFAEQKEKELAAKKALTAPDKDKLNKLAIEIDSIQLPDLKTPDARRINDNIKDLLTKVSKYIRENAEKL